MKKIKRNALKCLKCGDIIESKSVHDFVMCKCGSIAVDGGKAYLKRSFKQGILNKDFIDLTEYKEDENDEIS